MQHIARSKITDFISYIEIYSAFFSFFNNKWGNFAVIQRVVSIYNGDPWWVYRVYNKHDITQFVHTQFQEYR